MSLSLCLSLSSYPLLERLGAAETHVVVRQAATAALGSLALARPAAAVNGDPMIVGQTEADASKGRISYTSPIARAMIGKMVDEEIEVTVPSGDKFYLVEKIEFV